MWRRHQPKVGTAGLAASVVLVLVAACGQGGAPSPAPTAPASTAPGPTPTSGPSDYAAWVTRQGFGGSSGLANIRKLARWLGENTTVATAFDVNDMRTDVRALTGWLADHPATACWVAYHEAAAADLVKLDALYGKALDGIAAGAVSTDDARAIAATADAAADRPAPPGCP